MNPYKVNEEAISCSMTVGAAEQPVDEDKSEEKKVEIHDANDAYLCKDTDFNALKVKEPEPIIKPIDPVGQEDDWAVDDEEDLDLDPNAYWGGEPGSPGYVAPPPPGLAYPMVVAFYGSSTMYVAGDYLDMRDPDNPVSVIDVEEADRPYMIPDFPVRLASPEAARIATVNLNTAIQNFWNERLEAGSPRATFGQDFCNFIMNYKEGGRRIWRHSYMKYLNF